MTNSEFKAWFEGFSEGIEKTPTIKQWAKIQEKISQINDLPAWPQYITRYVDRYVYPYNTYPLTYCSAQSNMSVQQTATTSGYMAIANSIQEIGKKDFEEVR